MSEVELLPIAAALARLEGPALAVDARQCVRARCQKASCRACADYCPTGAINLDDPEMTNPAWCIHCGVCAAVCPTGVFEASSPSNNEMISHLEQLAGSVSSIAFACPNVPLEDAPGAIPIPCLGRLDCSILVSAAALGIRRIELVDGQCLSCPYETGRQAAELAARDANTLFQACAADAEVVCVPRSAAMQAASQRLGPAAASTFPGDEARPSSEVTIQKGTLPTHIPAKHQLLLSNLARLPHPGAHQEIETGLWAALAIGDGCTGCQMCAFFCPTGALTRAAVNQQPALAFTAAICTNCRLCAEICYSSAIALSTRIDLERVLALNNETVWCNTQTSSYEEKLKRLRTFKPAQ